MGWFRWINFLKKMKYRIKFKGLFFRNVSAIFALKNRLYFSSNIFIWWIDKRWCSVFFNSRISLWKYYKSLMFSGPLSYFFKVHFFHPDPDKKVRLVWWKKISRICSFIMFLKTDFKSGLLSIQGHPINEKIPEFSGPGSWSRSSIVSNI